MAVKKRKVVRPTPKKVVKKTLGRTAKKTVLVKTKKTQAKAKVTVSKNKPVKTVAVQRQPSITSVDKAFTKSQLFNALSGCSGIPRKTVSTLFDELSTIIGAHLKKQGPGHFTLPGLFKITVKQKPATKARKGVNPFTGAEMTFKAKPARNVVKLRPLQKLKGMA